MPIDALYAQAFKHFGTRNQVGDVSLRIFYFSVLVILGIVSILMGIKDAAFIFTFLTFGVGLFIAPMALNGFILMLAFLPLVLVGLRHVWVGLALSVLAFGCIFYLPGVIGRQQAANNIASLGANDVTATAFTQNLPETLELIFNGPVLDCNPICISLLHGNALAWLRVSSADPEIQASVTYALNDGLPVVTDNTEPAQIVLSIGNSTVPLSLRDSHTQVTDLRILEVTLNGANEPQTILRTTEITQRIPNTLTRFVPYFRGINSEGYTLTRQRHLYNQFDLRDALQTMGYSMPAADNAGAANQQTQQDGNRWPTPTPEETSIVVSIIDAHPQGIIPPEQLSVVKIWINAARWQDDLPPESADLVAKMMFALSGEQLSNTKIHQLFDDQPAVQSAIMPAIFDMIEGNIPSDNRFLNKIYYILMTTSFDPNLVTQYQQRLADFLIENPNEVRRNPLYIAIAENFGLDPLPLLDHVLSDQPRAVYFGKLTIAVCALDFLPTGHLGEPFANVVRVHKTEDGRLDMFSSFYRGLGLLLRDGQADTAREILAQSNLRDTQSHEEMELFGQIIDPAHPDYKNCDQ